jgi:carboxyl-terminal processing protease
MTVNSVRQAIKFCVLLSTIASCGLLNADGATGETDTRANEIAAELVKVFDLVLDHHVYPVTKQQMAHGCLAHAHQQVGTDMPADLVKEISRTVDDDGFRRLLKRELTALFESNPAREIAPREALAMIGVRITPAEDQKINEQIAANRYVGIGIAISAPGPFPVIQRIFPGGPAEQVGAKQGDAIVEVDGVSLKDVDLLQSIQRLRGGEGSELEIVLRRDGLDRTVKLTRAVVPMATVSPPLISQSGKTVGIKLNRLSASNVHELRKINVKLDAKVEAVVLDFRSADGLNLHYGELLANALIDDDAIGFIVDADGGRRRVDAEPGTIFADRRLLVVIDGATGGVLKWIAAALQNTGQAVLYGDPSTAPAMTVSAMEIGDGVSVSLPTRALLRANGERLTPSSELLVSPAGIRVPSRVALTGTPTRVSSAVLYPNQPFPISATTSSPANFRSPLRTRDLKSLIESIEQEPQPAAASPTR